jgi:hypothetical protein
VPSLDVRRHVHGTTTLHLCNPDITKNHICNMYSTEKHTESQVTLFPLTKNRSQKTMEYNMYSFSESFPRIMTMTGRSIRNRRGRS